MKLTSEQTVSCETLREQNKNLWLGCGGRQEGVIRESPKALAQAPLSSLDFFYKTYIQR